MSPLGGPRRVPLRVHLPGLRFLAWSFFCPCMHACPRTHARTRICTRVRVRAAYPSRAHARAPTRIGTGTQAGVSKAGMHGGARAGRQAHARAGSCERASERARLHGHPRMHARAGMLMGASTQSPCTRQMHGARASLYALWACNSWQCGVTLRRVLRV